MFDEEIYYEDVLERDNNDIDNLDDSSKDLDETPLPFYMKNMFKNYLTESETIVTDHGDKERGNWETQFECLLSCIGYAVGTGNLWRFPSKVYRDGGGSFLIIYTFFFLLFGGPMMMLEMSLGQFCGQSCSRAFEFCPALMGIGYTIIILAFVKLIEYTTIVARCMIYFGESFRYTLPWTVCTNSFNTPRCINASLINVNLTNLSYTSSIAEFWNIYVTGEENHDGSFITLDDPFGKPIIPMLFCMLVVLCLAGLTIMFGVKISGKIIYITVLFPYISIIQFVILGCSLPGSVEGIKYYLYPDTSKLFDPHVYLSVLEQLMVSCGIGAGGLITMSSFNRFRDKIQRNVIIVMLADYFTSIISGFAIFPVLGYMSLQSGKHINELFLDESGLFFVAYPHALSAISSSNMWSVLFMLMAMTLGIDTLFVLLETVVMAIADYNAKLYTRPYKILITTLVCLLIFLLGILFISPGGFNLFIIFDYTIIPFVLTFIIIMESISICCVYGMVNFQQDIELMTGERLGLFWVVSAWFFIPICATLLLIIVAAQSEIIIRRNIPFPNWTKNFAWISKIVMISPIFFVFLYILIKTKLRNPELNLKDFFKLCFKPPPHWGPKFKRYWIQSPYYSKKLIKYKDHPKLVGSLNKEEDITKLVSKIERRLSFNIEK